MCLRLLRISALTMMLFVNLSFNIFYDASAANQDKPPIA